MKPVKPYGPIRPSIPDVWVFGAGAVVGMLLLCAAMVIR